MEEKDRTIAEKNRAISSLQETIAEKDRIAASVNDLLKKCTAKLSETAECVIESSPEPEGRASTSLRSQAVPATRALRQEPSQVNPRLRRVASSEMASSAVSSVRERNVSRAGATQVRGVIRLVSTRTIQGRAPLPSSTSTSSSRTTTLDPPAGSYKNDFIIVKIFKYINFFSACKTPSCCSWSISIQRKTFATQLIFIFYVLCDSSR